MVAKNLQQSYQEQLVKAGVEFHKAERAAQILTLKELQLISDIWPEWATVFYQIDDKTLEQNSGVVHCSVYSLSKRLVDIFGALVGLLITFVITIPIAIAMQFDSPGPIFYSQIRCGLREKPFRIWKFRSMVKDAERQKHLVKNEAEGFIFKNKNDPRITRVGKFLRCTSLDEFPQFWNILLGQMSLVGTRPPTPDEVRNYQSYHYKRLLVKPGMTGEWQANGRSGVKSFEEIVRMDLDYQRKWSPLYDFKLILKTIIVILTRTGAF